MVGALFACVLGVKAQYDANFSHYFDMPTSFNPAAVGNQSKLNVTAAYAHNFAGFEHNPRTMYLSGDLPVRFLNSFHGVGGYFMNDQIGLFTHQSINAQYALQRKLFGGVLAIGLQAGMLTEQFDGTKLDPNEANDPALPTTKESGNAVDMGVGVFFNNKDQWYVGASAKHLNAPKVKLGERNTVSVDPMYYLTAGYRIKFRNPFVTLQPSILARTDLSGYRLDVTSRVVYNNENRLLYGGVSYSPTNSVTFLIGGSVKGFVLGYSYELYTSAISVGNGSHELFIGYQTDINFAKKGRNKHQSVRIL